MKIIKPVFVPTMAAVFLSACIQVSPTEDSQEILDRDDGKEAADNLALLLTPEANEEAINNLKTEDLFSVEWGSSGGVFDCHNSGMDQSGHSNGQMNGSNLPIINTPTNNSQLTDSSVTFEHSSQAVWMYVGTEWGSRDLYHGPTSGCQTTVNGLPTDGSDIYVVLWSENDLYAKVYQYETALKSRIENLDQAPNSSATELTNIKNTNAGPSSFTSTSVGSDTFNCRISGVDQFGHTNGQMNGTNLPIINSPSDQSTLSGSTVTFEHSEQAVWMYVGSEWGSRDLYHGPTNGCNTTVTNLPTDGSDIFVVLWSEDDLYAKVYKYKTGQ